LLSSVHSTDVFVPFIKFKSPELVAVLRFCVPFTFISRQVFSNALEGSLFQVGVIVSASEEVNVNT